MKVRNWHIALMLILSGFGAFGQIDMRDTTAVVIAHWNMNEVQQYKITESLKSKEGEQVFSDESTQYIVNVKVIDSTQAGYILEWTRTNFEVISATEPDKSFERISEGIPFWLLTDEFGSSIQLLNWEDVGRELQNRADSILQIYPGSLDVQKEVNKLKRLTRTKAEMETNFIQDVQQLFAFHGAKYKFDERIDLKLKVANNYGGDPLDANATMIMDQMNLDRGTFIIRSSQRINPHQLTAVTYDYLASLDIVGAELPSFEEFPKVTQLIWGGAEIHGYSGWVIFSEETKQTNNGALVTVEERTIELVISP